MVIEMLVWEKICTVIQSLCVFFLYCFEYEKLRSTIILLALFTAYSLWNQIRKPPVKKKILVSPGRWRLLLNVATSPFLVVAWVVKQLVFIRRMFAYFYDQRWLQHWLRREQKETESSSSLSTLLTLLDSISMIASINFSTVRTNRYDFRARFVKLAWTWKILSISRCYFRTRRLMYHGEEF